MKHLLKKKNVVGYCSEHGGVTVFVEKKVPLKDLKIKDRVPKSIGFFKKQNTKVEEIGKVTVSSPDRKKYRPVKGGCEISEMNSSRLGTGGLVVDFKKFRGLYLIGRWHSFIFLLERLGFVPEIKKGLLTNAHVTQRDVLNPKRVKIVQPGGRSGFIGRTIYNSVFSNSKHNKLDASLIELQADNTDEVISIGRIKGSKDVAVGERVYKYGRTTRFTNGECTNRGVTLNIGYGGDTGDLVLKGLDLFTKMSDKGDSGSVIVGRDDYVVSLLFADSSSRTIGIPIRNVFDEVKISVGGVR